MMIKIDTNHKSLEVIKRLNKINDNGGTFSTKDLKNYYINFKGVKANLTFENGVMFISIISKPFLVSENYIKHEITNYLNVFNKNEIKKRKILN